MSLPAARHEDLITRVVRVCHQEPPVRRGQPAGHETDRLVAVPYAEPQSERRWLDPMTWAPMIDIVPQGIPARDEPHCLGRRVGTATDPRNRRASSLVRVHETGGRSVRVYHQEDDGWRVFRYVRSFAATASWVDLPVGQRGHQRCSDPSGWRLRPASARLTLSRVSGRSAWRSGRDSARSS